MSPVTSPVSPFLPMFGTSVSRAIPVIPDSENREFSVSLRVVPSLRGWDSEDEKARKASFFKYSRGSQCVSPWHLSGRKVQKKMRSENTTSPSGSVKQQALGSGGTSYFLHMRWRWLLQDFFPPPWPEGADSIEAQKGATQVNSSTRWQSRLQAAPRSTQGAQRVRPFL